MKGLITGIKKAVAKPASIALLIELSFSFTGTKIKTNNTNEIRGCIHPRGGL